jgi:hypothetical protein
MAEESDGRDHDVASATHEPTAQVVQLPRDWFGPREELVPIGGRAQVASERGTAGAETGQQATPDQRARAPLAVDFWGGVTAVEDLVPFPSPSAHHPPRAEARRRRGPRLVSRPRVPRLPRLGPGRSVAAMVAVFACALIGVRVLAAVLSSARVAGRGEKVAQAKRTDRANRASGSLDARDEPRTLGVRVLPNPAHAHSAPRHRRRTDRTHHTAPAGRVTSGQPVSYSAPTTVAPATSHPVTTSPSPSPGSDRGSGGSGQTGGGSGGRSSGGGSSRAGPTGPGAAFGPGTLGK